MALIASIQIKFYWEQQDTDLSTCISCEEVIYGPMQVMYSEIDRGRGPEVQPTKAILCGACYDCLND